MAIRIKSERIHRMAKEPAAMTGETQVSAICRAFEEKLAEVRRAKEEGAAALSGAPNAGPQEGSS